MNIASVNVPRTAQTLFILDLIFVGFGTSLLANVSAQSGLNAILAEHMNVRLTPFFHNAAVPIYAMSIIGAFFVMGLYQRTYMHGLKLIKSGLTAGVLTWVFVGWPITQAGFLNRDILTTDFLIAHIVLFATLLIFRPVVCFYYGTYAKKSRVALIGSKAMQAVLCDVLARATPSEFVVVKNKQLNCAEDKEMLKHILRDLGKRPDIDQIVLDLSAQEIEMLSLDKKSSNSFAQGAELVSKSFAIEQCARWSGTENAKEAISHLYEKSTSRNLKYSVEILIALLALLFVLPLMVVVALAVKLEDGGAVLYQQKRVGMNNQVFSVLKFRSMGVDAEADGRARWAKVGDTRVTKVGRFIRLTRLDELPQLINIIRGDMALVGPRPERPEMVTEIEQNIPGYGLRHSVRPGLTGWAQINLAYTANIEDTIRKTQLDVYYIKNWSIWLDLAIIAQTARIVLFAEGAR